MLFVVVRHVRDFTCDERSTGDVAAVAVDGADDAPMQYNCGAFHT